MRSLNVDEQEKLGRRGLFIIMGLIGTILGVLGVYGFFAGNFTLVIIGGLAGLIENIIGTVSGQQTSLFTAIFAIIVGLIYAFFADLALWKGIFIGLCFEQAIMGGLTFVGLAVAGMASRNA